MIVKDIPELYSDHEEAGTKMLLHASLAAQSSAVPTDIINCTVDTDVFVLALWVSAMLTATHYVLYVWKSKLLNLKVMSSTREEHTAEALVRLHPFTGCDSVSSFKGKGKVKALKLLRKSQQYTRAFCELGKSWEIQPELQQDIEQFVRDLCGWRNSHDVKTFRFNCYRVGNVSESTLLRNHDCLKLHIQRTNYQAKIHKTCV